MKFETKTLYDKKGQLHSQMLQAYEEVRNRDGVPTAEEQRKFKAWEAEFDQVTEQINFHERMEKLGLEEVKHNATRSESSENKNKEFRDDATVFQRRNALLKSKENGYSSLTDDERAIVNTEMRDLQLFERILRNQELNAEEMKLMSKYREKRAQGSTGSAGGYTIPEGFAGRIVESLKYVSALQSWAMILRTSSGNTIDFPTNDDTNTTGEMIGESGDISNTAGDLTFGTFAVGAYKFSSKMIKVPSELIQDSGVDIMGYIARKLAQRLGRITNTYFTTGTGSSQPQGCLTGASQGKLTASASAFTPAELIAFQDSIDPAYRMGNKLAWSMHSNILSAIKQLTIGSNYNLGLWLPSFREGEPDRILGKPYFVNQALASSLSTGGKPIMYGDWDLFTIRMVNDINLRTLNERYAEYDQTAIFGLMRASSFVEDSAGLKYLEMT